MSKIKVLDKNISFYIKDKDDFISLTDIARYKSEDAPSDIVKNWTRRKDTIEFLGLWEKINNKDFKPVEFDLFKNNAGSNSFVLSPSKWISKTNAIGIITKQGKYGGTFAHRDIAFEFASWVSAEFKLYLIKEFQRLKLEENERKSLNWDIKRQLTKINYKIHTDAIKCNLIPKELNKSEVNKVYASEADVLNMALFGIIAKDWRKQNKDKKGNIRDYSNISQLICLSNLESFNSLFIKEGFKQNNRLVKLNNIAISQMKLLVEDKNVKKLEDKK
jgi:hypothetical protein